MAGQFPLIHGVCPISDIFFNLSMPLPSVSYILVTPLTLIPVSLRVTAVPLPPVSHVLVTPLTISPISHLPCNSSATTPSLSPPM